MMQPETAHLRPASPARYRMLVVGDRLLLGGVDRSAPGTGGVPSELVAQSAGTPGAVEVDAAWDLHAALGAVGNLFATGRLHEYDAVVVAIRSSEVLAMGRRLGHLLAPRRRLRFDPPPVVVLLAAPEVAHPDVQAASAVIDRLAEPIEMRGRLTVITTATGRTGVLSDPVGAASDVLRVLHRIDGPVADELREVEVDRSLRSLQGRTSDLRRAVVLAQSSFDVPYAQLNLVSRGALRSLAFIGRSSDGLERTLSAEAVRSDGPLLIADTRSDDRFVDIPETRGPDAVRYYAGHPVRSDHGHRIGVLCVLDTSPRDVHPGDDVLIRDLALLAEGELAALTGSGPR